ncbi:MAG: hypothetical protein R3337_00255 [Gammaproteobacteria bacterium]|nr:hypothetical protein [Gammaproteobacteria bacterium]
MGDKLYAPRDIEALDRAGNYYCRHLEAMTTEGLHSKSDIAAELAFRDERIQRLCREVARLNVRISMACEEPADDCECGGCLTASDFNEATDEFMAEEAEESAIEVRVFTREAKRNG